MHFLGDLYIDISKDDIKKLLKDNRYKDFFMPLLKSANRGLHPAVDWNKSKTFNLKNFSDQACFIQSDYISETDPKTNVIKDYKKIREEYGCLIVDNSETILCDWDMCHEISLIPNNIDFRFFPSCRHYDNNWGDALTYSIRNDDGVCKKVPIIWPINAAVITDNYLFSYINKEKQTNSLSRYNERKKYSLFAILRSIVPSGLVIPFHLTIFYCYKNGEINKGEAEQVIEDIKALNLCKDIAVTIVCHHRNDKTHNRKILTNYHYVESSIGFNNIDKNGIKQITEGNIWSIYDSLLNRDKNYNKTLIKHRYDLTRIWLKQILLDCHSDKKSFIVGDKINRLLDYPLQEKEKNDITTPEEEFLEFKESGEENLHT